MMIVLAAIGGLSASSLRSGQHVERHLAEVENAQQILAGMPGRSELANRMLTGEMAGYRDWTPETIVLTLQGPNGAPLSFDMVRLVKAVAK